MALTSWPPASAPAWPPPEYPGGVIWSNLLDMVIDLRGLGYTSRAPTSAERTSFFSSARCDEAHQVTGRMLISPAGTAYPFAVCNNAAHRQVLVLWGPDYCVGAMVERNLAGLSA